MSHLTRGPIRWMGIGSKARWSAEQGPRSRGCDRGDAQGAREMIPTHPRPLPGRTYRQSRQALLRRPRAIPDRHRHENLCTRNCIKEVSA
jgi:hypothetical protein